MNKNILIAIIGIVAIFIGYKLWMKRKGKTPEQKELDNQVPKSDVATVQDQSVDPAVYDGNAAAFGAIPTTQAVQNDLAQYTPSPQGYSQ